MNDTEWATHNLQRQRQILEERQRQRRMQSNGILSSDFGRPPIGSPTSTSTLLTRSSSTSVGFRESTSNANVGSYYDRNFSSNNVNGRNDGFALTNVSASLNNSLYSLSNGNTTQEAAPDKRKITSTQIHHSDVPQSKVITVKGFTPPEFRKNNDAEFKKNEREASLPQKPVVTVDRLERLNFADSVRFINSENEDDNNKTLSTSTSEQRCELWEEIGQPKKNRKVITDERNNGDKPENEESESIPTEIVNEENPIGVVDIVNNLDQFVMQPTKKNTTLKCKITRDKKGMYKGMFPIYYLHLEKFDGRRIFLLAGRRRKKSTTANYLISTDPTDLSRDGRSFIAKIRSNAVGTSFTIYDKGENPKKASVIGEGIRQELAAVIYETNVLGLRGPRKMTIIIPGIYVDEKHNYARPMAIRPISEKDTILERYKSHRLDEMVVLNNKQPVWSEESQSYVLNFHGRVTQASVKNFQIVHSVLNDKPQDGQGTANIEQNEYIVMQFGRIDNDNFTMDIRFPLSPVQAFGIAMSSFHKKIACD